MAKCLNALDGFSIRDLMQQDGLVFDIGNDCESVKDEEFAYSSDVTLSNEEALNLLKMDNFEDNENYDSNDDGQATICGINFETLKSKMTSIYEDGKIMKLVKQKGVGNVVPFDAQVTVTYMGFYEYTDEPFDSSLVRGGKETFRLNQGMLIPGLEIAIASMQKHEIAVFIIHPDLAYGKYGCAPRIPPNEEILFLVQLFDYLDDGTVGTFEHMSPEEKRQFPNVVKRVQAKFNTAKDCFGKHKIKQAIREYSRALQWLEEAELQNQEQEDEANKLLTRGYNNLAVCFNLENMPRRVCNACNRVPQPTAKTHFNYGRALWRMGEYSRAMEKLQLALKMEPKNVETVKEIRLVNEKHRQYLEMEKQLWRNCLKIEGKGEKDLSTFQKAVRDMCAAFQRETHVLRQPLPEGLTPEEDKYIREQAASFGLTVTTHERYGREITYLNKPKY